MRVLLFGLLVWLASGAAPAAAADCEALAKLSLPHTTVTLAETVRAGAFRPAKPFAVPGPPPHYERLPAFCRVAATVSAAKDSVVRFEVWMPQAGWNGKFLAVGNGGYSGEIWYPYMVDPLERGYATASTDTGHEGAPDDASFALGHPQKWIDFAYRAVHETVVQSKAIIDAYYGGAPKHAYWDGCSTGGRQGLMEAQRYPADFDGIIAGAPANYMTHMSAQQVAVLQALHASPASYLPPEKIPALHAAVLKACDAADGVRDGVLENPQRCRFDPAVLACHGADSASCLTPVQVATARRFYAPLVNPRTHAILFPGFAPGSELAWTGRVGAIQRVPPPLFSTMFRYVVFMNPRWDYRTLNFDEDMARTDHSEAAISNAISPDLKPFFARGGKLIQYHGWADPGISPYNSIDYYESVAKASGGAEALSAHYRLFMIPGMEHCRGGEGTDDFDRVSTLEAWVERGEAPQRIVASRSRGGKVDRTRPLCPYPQVAVYKGSGSTDDAASFGCESR
jgi:feruloyl esterase